jgi:ABC-type oligopeptide transport system substrate-binding subunit/class 3 adenylate cyclase
MPELLKSRLTFPDLPEGTVTFLFTDIEGSTQLLDRLRDQYATLLADQRSILRSAFAKWNGSEIDTQGDAFFVAFPRATEAVSAVVDIQRTLATHTWPQNVEVRVRMGLHTGEPLKAEEGYVGMDVHRAARIAHVGHGGQVLLSETTTPLLRDELPEGVSLLDLGRHRLKDLRQPEHIRQLVIEGLPSEFPPLKSLEELPPELALGLGAVHLPSFLEPDAETEGQVPVFVARERELAQLDGCLQEMLSGEGKVVFLEGGPGRGKTALLEAFARSAIATHPDLLVFSGDGNAHTGIGDPYLLFREALSMLSGDVEAKWAAGSISTEHARRLWEICPFTAQSLVNYGPDLVEVFVSGKGLLARISAAVPDQRGLLQALRALADKTGSGSGDLEQKALFEQYTQVLIQIAERHPLVLVLDDLQWADTASINLLFHLGRCLGGHRILVVGAYRAEEITLGRGDDRHPLERVLNEFKRLYGDVCIDLSQQPEEEERRFVDALLDNEPNRLGEEFCQALHAHTGGHPLFTIELLRNLQERGDLVQDENGCWLEGSHLDWNVLPPRVEGVIEERICRLEDELRDLLAVASVEGEDFTAQVVAQVEELNERRLLRQLSGELEKRHRLVHGRGEQVVGEHTLSQYRFSHALFQQFLYNDLSPGERRLLHKEVAQVLEQLYAGNLDQISLQLAHHYSQANEGEKAVHYLILVGDQARNIYGHQEAIDFYQRALSFQEKLGDYDGAARTQMKLGQTYHSNFDYKRANESYEQGFRLWQRASEIRSAVPFSPSPDPLRLLIYRDPFTLDPGLSNDIHSASIIDHLFSGLLEYTPEMAVLPDVAQRWEIQEGGRRYVFHLREDTHWSDGTPVTAEDFVYAWRRVLNPANQSGSEELLYDIKGARAFHQGETSDTESLGIRTNGPYTLEVELEEPAGYFLQLMAHETTFPIPRHVVERLGEKWTEVDSIVVNGPFLIKKWQHGKSLTLVRNLNHSGRFSGNLQRVEINIHSISESQNLIAMYEADDLDMMQITYFPPEEKNRLRRQHLSDYFSTPNLTVRFLVFNTVRAPFDDPRIRQAFMMAADKQARGTAASEGPVIPARGGILPPGMPGHSPDIGMPYDPIEAQELMAQAGYPNGRGFPVVEVIIWPDAEGQMEGIRRSWREALGVEVAYKKMSLIDVHKIAKCEPFHMALQGWAPDYPDPDNFLRVGFRKEISGWDGAAFDGLVVKARRILDQTQRLKLYQEADRILIEEAVVLPFIYNMTHLLVKPWVKRFPILPMFGWFLKDVVIEPH